MIVEWSYDSSYDSPPTSNVQLTKDDWDLCLMITSKLQRMMDNQDAPSRSITQTTKVIQSPVIPQGVDDDSHNIEVAHLNNDPLHGIPFLEPSSEEFEWEKKTKIG